MWVESLQTLTRVNSSTKGDLGVQRLATHGKCSRVASKSGVYFSLNFSLSVDMGALWIARDYQDLSWGCDNAIKCILVIYLCEYYLLITMFNL